MPVRSNSRRLGGSLYRWVVLRFLRRRLQHPEGHNAHIKSSNSSGTKSLTTQSTSQHQKHQQQKQSSARLCAGAAEPTHGRGSPKGRENGKSAENGFKENSFGSCRREDFGRRSLRRPVGGGGGETSTFSSTIERDLLGQISLDSSLVIQGGSLPEIESVKETAQFFRSTTQLESKADKGKKKVVLVKEVGGSYGPEPSHIKSSSNGRRRRVSNLTPPSRKSGRSRRPSHELKRLPRGVEDGDTRDYDKAGGPSGNPKSFQGFPSKKKSLKSAESRRATVNAYPLLDVRGLEAGSVQSLTTPVPTVCQHINSLRRWDSISVLYGIEYLLVRKKVHERLLCILRERRLRRGTCESVLSGGRHHKRPHKRKRKKRKGKGKHEKRKDVKTKKKVCVVIEERSSAVSPLHRHQKKVAHLECQENVDQDFREGQTREKRKANGEPSVILGEAKKEKARSNKEEQEEDEEGEEGEEGEIRTRFNESGSFGSGDSRPSKSPSYHQVTGSEKSSTSSLSYRNKSRETPTRDISPQVTTRTSLKTVSSSSTESSTSSSSTSSSEDEEEEDEEAGDQVTSSPSVKSTGGPSFSTKTSPTTCAYISDDESASERRRSSLYCCPCFVTFKRKIKKIRRR